MSGRKRIYGMILVSVLATMSPGYSLFAQQNVSPSAAHASKGWVADATRAKIPRHKAEGQLGGTRFEARTVALGTGAAFNMDPRTNKETTKDFDVISLVFLSGPSITEGDVLSVLVGGKALSDRIEITLRLQPGKTLAGRTILVHPTDTKAGSSSPESAKFLFQKSSPVSVVIVPKGKDPLETPYLEDRGDAFTLRLQFGKQTEKTLRGQIYLCVSDQQKSYVAGSFVAKEFSEKDIKR